MQLIVSTLTLRTVFIRTEWAILDDLFSTQRRLAIVLVVVLGFAQGGNARLLDKPIGLFAEWLVWRCVIGAPTGSARPPPPGTATGSPVGAEGKSRGR